MQFDSIAFAIFLPLVFMIYWLIADRYKWALLLIASYYFYASWNIQYSVLILFTTAISYICARYIEKKEKSCLRKAAVTICIILCLGVLVFFKYFNFLSLSLSEIAGCIGIQYDPFMLDILLPVGISFYTFQTLSYVIDVYRGNTPAEHHFGKYATFVSFFPQLVAGPIERSSRLLPQISAPKPFNYELATGGLKQMAWGFFKKIAVADSLAPFVNEVYATPHAYNGFVLTCASLAFALQIYCDFSAYSDIAIGAAKLFSIRLMTNFASPYFSCSVKEFWSRWHISLSTWLRDYVYIPLGGNRCSYLRHKMNLMVTFLISGLWHGASWNFVIWGGLHGGALVAENVLKLNNVEGSKCVSLFRWGVTLLFCCICWIFFRAETLEDAVYILTHLFDNWQFHFHDCKNRIGYVTVGCMSIVLMYDFIKIKNIATPPLSTPLRWLAYAIAVGCLLHCAASSVSTKSEFIYFQF